jgi:hypothetical protein
MDPVTDDMRRERGQPTGLSNRCYQILLLPPNYFLRLRFTSGTVRSVSAAPKYSSE